MEFNLFTISFFRSIIKSSKLTLNISVLLFSSFILIEQTSAQSNFDIGYKMGYENGYCFKHFPCVPPLVPITPIPYLGETFNSYSDGYNRGVVEGYNQRRFDDAKNNINKSSDNSTNWPAPKVYETPTVELDFTFLKTVLAELGQRNNTPRTEVPKGSKIDYDDLDARANKYINELTNADSMRIRFTNTQLLRNTYLNFEYKPRSIKDGIYIVKKSEIDVLNEDLNGPCFDNGKIKVNKGECNEITNLYAYVKEGKIVLLTDALKHNGDVFIPRGKDWILFANKETDMNRVIVSDDSVINGRIHLQVELWQYTNGNLHKYDASIGSYYYFIDYLTKYNFTQKCIHYQNENKSKNKIAKIADGYHYFKVTNGIDFFEIKKVYILNNKVAKYFKDETMEEELWFSSELSNNCIQFRINQSKPDGKYQLVDLTLFIY